MLNKERWYSLFVLGACVLFSFILYAPVLDSYFVSEDLRHVNFGWSEVMAEWSSYGQSVGFRPGTVLYLVINNLLWARNPIGHHAVVFFLHGVVGWLTYLITQRVRGERVSATLAAMVFVGAPVHSEAVIWLAAAAGTVVSGLLCMVAAWVWIREENGPSPLSVALVAGLYFCALLVKEVAIPLPGLLLLLDWAMKRIPTSGTVKALASKVISYWPLGVALCLYLFLHLRAGALQGTINYGVHLDVSFGQIVEWWSLYARDLFKPLSSYVEWKIGPRNWIWLAAFLVLLHVVRQARWAAYWVFLALLPGATVYGQRLTYQAVIGFGIVVAVSLVDLIQQFNRSTDKLRPFWTLTGIGMFMLVLLVGDIRAVHRDAANWVEAGRLTWSIPRQAKERLPDLPPRAELFFIDLPDNINGAYAFRWGIQPEVRYVYGDQNLTVHHVLVRQHRWGKTPLSSIECESDVPRFFFRYHADSDKLDLVTIQDFGVACPATVDN